MAHNSRSGARAVSEDRLGLLPPSPPAEEQETSEETNIFPPSGRERNNNIQKLGRSRKDSDRPSSGLELFRSSRPRFTQEFLARCQIPRVPFPESAFIGSGGRVIMRIYSVLLKANKPTNSRSQSPKEIKCTKQQPYETQPSNGSLYAPPLAQQATQPLAVAIPNGDIPAAPGKVGLVVENGVASSAEVREPPKSFPQAAIFPPPDDSGPLSDPFSSGKPVWTNHTNATGRREDDANATERRKDDSCVNGPANGFGPSTSSEERRPSSDRAARPVWHLRQTAPGSKGGLMLTAIVSGERVHRRPGRLLKNATHLGSFSVSSAMFSGGDRNLDDSESNLSSDSESVSSNYSAAADNRVRHKMKMFSKNRNSGKSATTPWNRGGAVYRVPEGPPSTPPLTLEEVMESLKLLNYAGEFGQLEDYAKRILDGSTGKSEGDNAANLGVDGTFEDGKENELASVEKIISNVSGPMEVDSVQCDIRETGLDGLSKTNEEKTAENGQTDAAQTQIDLSTNNSSFSHSNNQSEKGDGIASKPATPMEIEPVPTDMESRGNPAPPPTAVQQNDQERARSPCKQPTDNTVPAETKEISADLEGRTAPAAATEVDPGCRQWDTPYKLWMDRYEAAHADELEGQTGAADLDDLEGLTGAGEGGAVPEENLCFKQVAYWPEEAQGPKASGLEPGLKREGKRVVRASSMRLAEREARYEEGDRYTMARGCNPSWVAEQSAFSRERSRERTKRPWDRWIGVGESNGIFCKVKRRKIEEDDEKKKVEMLHPQRVGVSCRKLAPLKLSKCRDCQRSDADHSWCQFMGYRIIKMVDNGAETFGWLTAENTDILQFREKYWMSSSHPKCSPWTQTQACYVLQNVARHLEAIIDNEFWLLRCLEYNKSDNLTRMPGFRHSVQVRELCDVCATTIFNLHLMCGTCGFIACIDCIRERNLGGLRLDQKKKTFDLDKFGWPNCRQKKKVYGGPEGETHAPENLILAQIIPDPSPIFLSTIMTVQRQMHQAMETNRVASECVCSEERTSEENLLRCFCAEKPEPPPQPSSEIVPFRGIQNAAPIALAANAAPSDDDDCEITCIKPVIVGNVHKRLDEKMWTPQYFQEAKARFEKRNITGLIIDCRTGRAVSHAEVSVDEFWEGFLDSTQAPTWSDGNKMYLKLKDYPGKSSFKEALPDHYKEYCLCLPLPEYTAPEMDGKGRGIYNLVTSLPSDRYVRPDLGPKMYTAYGMLFDTKKASTNMHLDISDAVNVMVNVTVPEGCSEKYMKEQVLSHCRREGVSEADMARVERNWKEAGAIWTIFLPQDNDMIKQWIFECKAEAKYIQELPRDFQDQMNNCKVDDPIHDQTFFLTGDLQRLLRKWSGPPNAPGSPAGGGGASVSDGQGAPGLGPSGGGGVRGFTFVQMLGDAVFIPAGAAHQVQNLLSCIKVAEDFVTPEGVTNSALVANEFRYLTREHANREDKLQLKNIIYHAILESIGALKDEEEEESAENTESHENPPESESDLSKSFDSDVVILE